MPTKHSRLKTEQPNFESPELSDLAAAFRRRGKALRYHGKLSIVREVESDLERLDVHHVSLRVLHLQLSVWSTGEWWFLACQRRAGRNSGWLFKRELRGQLARTPADEIVRAFEASMLIGYWASDEQLANLRTLWQSAN